jgi:hypothetical protein
MVAITAANSATSSLQTVLNKTRIEQARREADQAEANAQSLRAQADEEERRAQEGQARVRNLSSQTRQQDGTYTSAIKANASAVPATTQDFMERLYKATSQKFADSGNPLKTDAKALPVVNSQGQSTGRILNLSA